jgi:hypothetical protein
MGFALTPGEAPLHFSRSKNVMHVEARTRFSAKAMMET